MSDPTYEIGPKDPRLEATHAALSHEIRPGNTVTFVVEIDLTAIENAQTTTAKSGFMTPSYTAFVVKAVGTALRDFPYANIRVHRGRLPLSGPRLKVYHHTDVAVAVESDSPDPEVSEGVIVVRNAGRLSPAEITAALADPTAVRLGRDPAGCAALVGTPGRDAADAVIGTWSYPIGVSIGRTERRPVVADGVVKARTACTLTLNFDRRLMAGARAARFLHRIVECLEGAAVEPTPLEPPAGGREV